jgi:hypothetical protein
MAPTQQPFVRGDQSRIVDDGGGGDEPIGRIAVQAVELAGNNRNFSGQRQFDHPLFQELLAQFPDGIEPT